MRSGNQEKPVYTSATKMLTDFESTAIEVEETAPNARRRKWTSLTLNFLTPTRIVYDGQLTLDIEFHMIVRNLLRRISLLSYFHGNNGTSTFNFKGIIEKAEKIETVSRRLSWYGWERYSGRQERKIDMSGFVGEITFEGDLRPFMSLIQAGEVLHVGKGTAFGLGRYEVGQSSLPTPSYSRMGRL